jgi:hypothetical protein
MRRWLIPSLCALVALGWALPASPSPALAQEAVGPPLPGAPVRVGDAELSVALSPREPTVGDRVTALFTFTAPVGDLAGGEPAFPDWQGSWGAAEVVSFDAPERLADRNGIATWRQRVELTAFRPGRIELPSVEVTVPLTPEAGGERVFPSPGGLGFTVTSVLPTEGEAAQGTAEGEAPALEPRPPEAPEELPLGTAFWALAAALSALTAALLWWLWKSRRPAGAAAPALGPFEELETSLAACRTRATPVEAHALLSSALRRYLGRRLSFAALESSTTEIRRRLHRAVLPASAVEGVITVLGTCDVVKFDRRDASETSPRRGEGVLQDRLDLARRAATALESHLRPPEPAGEGTIPPAPPTTPSPGGRPPSSGGLSRLPSAQPGGAA